MVRDRFDLIDKADSLNLALQKVLTRPLGDEQARCKNHRL